MRKIESRKIERNSHITDSNHVVVSEEFRIAGVVTISLVLNKIYILETNHLQIIDRAYG